jgi:hypothetical protein
MASLVDFWRIMGLITLSPGDVCADSNRVNSEALSPAAIATIFVTWLIASRLVI